MDQLRFDLEDLKTQVRAQYVTPQPHPEPFTDDASQGSGGFDWRDVVTGDAPVHDERSSDALEVHVFRPNMLRV